MVEGQSAGEVYLMNKHRKIWAVDDEDDDHKGFKSQK